MNMFFLVCVTVMQYVIPAILFAAFVEHTRIGNRLMKYFYAIIEYVNR